MASNSKLAQALRQLAKESALIVKEAAEEFAQFGENLALTAEQMAADAKKADAEIARRLNRLARNIGRRAKPTAKFGTSTSTDYQGTFFDANPAQEGKVVVHHAVEQQVQTRYPGLVSDSELNSLDNLRGIPKGTLNNRVHLSAIRKLWNKFYASNPDPSQQDLLDFASRIDGQFGDVFDPPLQ
jgi:predicted DNA-binding protein